MRPKKSTRLTLSAILVLSAATCSSSSGAAKPSPSPTDGKIPITTKSDAAKKEFLLGRDLSERLLGQDSLPHFDKALALDPNFASAELARANNSPTTKEFLQHLQ